MPNNLIIKIPTVKDIEDKLYEGSYPLHLDIELLSKTMKDGLTPEEAEYVVANQRDIVKQSFHNRAAARHYAELIYDVFMNPLSGAWLIAVSPDEIYINPQVTPEMLVDALGHETVHQILQRMKKNKAAVLLDSPLGASATVPSDYNPTLEHMAMEHAQQRMSTPLEHAMKRYKLEGSY